MNKAEYARRWSSPLAHIVRVIDPGVPDDIVRESVHEPCFMCGTARGLCRHRKAA